MSTQIKDLKIGESAEIVGYDSANPAYRSKLLAMGLTKGTVTPGQLPMRCLPPVSPLDRVVLPQFGLPARAMVTGLATTATFSPFIIAPPECPSALFC